MQGAFWKEDWETTSTRFQVLDMSNYDDGGNLCYKGN